MLVVDMEEVLQPYDQSPSSKKNPGLPTTTIGLPLPAFRFPSLLYFTSPFLLLSFTLNLHPFPLHSALKTIQGST